MKCKHLFLLNPKTQKVLFSRWTKLETDLSRSLHRRTKYKLTFFLMMKFYELGCRQTSLYIKSIQLTETITNKRWNRCKSLGLFNCEQKFSKLIFFIWKYYWLSVRWLKKMIPKDRQVQNVRKWFLLYETVKLFRTKWTNKKWFMIACD